MTICERMFQVMEEKGLKAINLARKLDISTGVTTGWKQRGTDPPAKYISQICEFLDCSMDYLLTGQETKKAPVPEISENGREMLELFDQLPDRDQLLLIGRLREMVSPMLEVEKKDLASSAEQAG